MEYDPSLYPAITIYRPRDMVRAKRLPIIVWANGACLANGGAGARPLLMELASDGYLVVSLGPPGSNPRLEQLRDTGAPPPLPPVPPGHDQTQPAEIRQAIDWAIAENDRAGSPYRGKVETTRVAVMGHSCGGLQALAVQDDPRIVTSMIWHSGIYDRPAGRIGVRLNKADIEKVRRPIAYVIGGKSDIAYEGATTDFARLPHVPAALFNADLGHGGSLTQPNGGTGAKIAKAWLGYWLRKELSAADYFSGENCGICQTQGWTVTLKNWPRRPHE
jgi:hypothetical protein